MHRLKRLLLAREPVLLAEIYPVPLGNWVHPASTKPLPFPWTVFWIVSSCRNKPHPGWQPCANVRIWAPSFFATAVVLRRSDEKKKKKTYLPDDHSIPRTATLNISCADFIIACSCSHSGIVGKVSSASMVFGHHCISYGLPAVLFRLACLSRLSTVEKDTDIETYKKKTNTRRHRLFSAERFSSPSIWGEKVELLLSGLAWKQLAAGCLSVSRQTRSIRSGWWTDRWRLCAGNERRKALEQQLLCQRQSPSNLRRETQMLKWEHGRPCKNPHLLAQFRFSINLNEISWEQNSSTSDGFPWLVSFSIFNCFFAHLFFLRNLLFVQIVSRHTHNPTLGCGASLQMWSGPLGDVVKPKAAQ